MATTLIKYSPGVIKISEAYRELRSDPIGGDWIKVRNHALAVLGTSGCINTEIVKFNGKVTKLKFNTDRVGEIALKEEVRVVIHSFEEGRWKVVFEKTFPLKTPALEFEVNAIVKNYTYIAVCPNVRASVGEVTWYITLPLVYYEPIQPPKPVIVREKTGLVWDNKLHRPGTYNLPKGKKFDIKLTVRNEGGTGKVEAVVFVNGSPALRSVDEVLGGGEKTFWFLNRIIEQNMDIVLRVRPYGETEWTDQDG